MVTISKATIKDIPIIQEIAYKTWPVAYGQILSSAQLDYMLEMMYSSETLNDNITNKGHIFLLAREASFTFGFASCEHHYLDKNTTRLHKLYLLPEEQGKGIGELLLDKVIFLAKENHSERLSLNVNKFNKAFGFYKQMGFEVVSEEDLEIGNGYLMEDYKMELKI